jgi:hypothetical protein
MGSVTQDRLYQVFVAIAGEQATTQSTMIEAREQLASSVSDAGKAIQATSATIATQGTSGADGPVVSALENLSTTQAASNTVATSSASTAGSIASSLVSTVFGGIPLVGGIQNAQTAASGGGIGSEVESIASSVLKSGLGMLPLVSGLIGLFGGGGSPDPPPLVKYAMPASLTFQGAEMGSGLGNGDYDQNGMPRAYGGGASSAGGSAASSGGTPGAAVAPSAPAAQQITVNVQAMDARSFLDRSSDIAAAVRDAMLNLSSINDVVNDL